jgi:hypothetical protein
MDRPAFVEAEDEYTGKRRVVRIGGYHFAIGDDTVRDVRRFARLLAGGALKKRGHSTFLIEK